MLTTCGILTSWLALTALVILRAIRARKHRASTRQGWSGAWTWTIVISWAALTVHVCAMHSPYVSRLHYDNMLWLKPNDSPTHGLRVCEPPSATASSGGPRHAVVTVIRATEEIRELHVQLGTEMYCIGNYEGAPPPARWKSGLDQDTVTKWIKSQIRSLADSAVDGLAAGLLNVVRGIKQGESVSEASIGNAESIHKEDVVLKRTGVGLAPFSLKEIALWIALWTIGVVYWTRKLWRCGAAM